MTSLHEIRLNSLAELFGTDVANNQWRLHSLEQTRLPVIITNPRLADNPVVYANMAASRLTGYSFQELVGRNCRHLLGEDSDQPALTLLREAISRGEDCQVLLRNYRKNGSLFWNELTIIPIRDNANELFCFVGIQNDVTAHKQLAIDKELIEDRLRAILNSAADAIITIDEQGIMLDLNQAVEKLFGYSVQELLGRNISILMPSPHRENHDGYLRRYLETGEKRVIGVGREVTARRKDGSLFPAEISVSKVDSKHLFSGIVRDISERQRNEEALRRELRLNENIIRTSRSIILILDLAGRIVQYNPCLEELSGWPLSEKRGDDWFETFVPPGNRVDQRERFSLAIAGRQAQYWASQLVTREGSVRDVEWNAAPLISPEGDVTGLLCNGQDVTVRHRLEREVLNVAAEEQRRIGQDLHDVIGQELTALAMLADTLSFALERRRVPEAMLAAKINQDLKVTLGKVRLLSRGLNPVDIDAGGLMSALEAISRRLRDIHGIECSFACPEPVLLKNNQVANHLYRIAEEATTNALRHSQADRIELGLSRHGDYAELTIRDNGIGFHPEQHEDRGLGLRIMEYRSRLVGGHLTVESSRQAGTAIRCRVRLDSILTEQ